MAKFENGYMGGFSGKLGTAIGYMWNGRWCLRSRPTQVSNPRTEAQQKHRALFREQVRLAARMRWVLRHSLTEPARAAGMTAYNLFVSLNQHAFSSIDGQLSIDYPSLMLSQGPVAPVQAGTVSVQGGLQLEVAFERNPLHLQCDAYDEVRLFVYSPSAGEGFLTAPVYRRQKKISVLLPDVFAGSEVHLYLYATDREGRCSETAYGGSLMLADNGVLSNESEDLDEPSINQTIEMPSTGHVGNTMAAGTASGQDAHIPK